MLELEVPNLQELDLDRVIAFGHTWSPTLELTPEVPFFHGHAITIDMAFSTTSPSSAATSPSSERDRIFWLMSQLGLALDSPHLTPELLQRGDRLDRADPRRPAARRGARRRSAPVRSSTTSRPRSSSAPSRSTDEVVRSYPRGGDGEDVFTLVTAAAP